MGATTEDVDLDLARVPVYPMVRLELREQREEVVEGLVDGRVVSTGDLESARAAVLTAASLAAAARPLRAIRVKLTGFGDDAEGVVDEAGVLHIAGPATAGRRAGGRRLLLKVLAGTLLMCVPVGGLGWVALDSGVVDGVGGGRPAAASPVPTPTRTELPVVAPPGWGSVAAWSLPVGVGAAPTVATSGSLVFVPAADGAGVSAVNAADGRQVWAADMPGSALVAGAVGGPVLAELDGRSVLVAWSTTTVAAWDPESGRAVGSWPLPEDGSTVVKVGATVIVAGQSRRVGVLAGGRLQWRVLSATGVPVGVTPSGSLIAAAEGQAWKTDSEQLAGPAVTLQAPEGSAWSSVAGLAGPTLVAAFAVSAEEVVLRGFSTDTWAPLWTSTPVSVASGSSGTGVPPLWVAPGAGWGLYGSAWVDLRTGAVKALPPDWSTSSVGAGDAFGVAGGGVGVVSAPGVFTAPLSDSSTLGSAVPPVAVTDAGVALIVASDGAATFLYAVPAQVRR